MKVKIKDTIYDAEQEPIMLILSEQDKQNIQDMLPEATKYCVYPDTMSEEAVSNFMENKPIQLPDHIEDLILSAAKEVGQEWPSINTQYFPKEILEQLADYLKSSLRLKSVQWAELPTGHLYPIEKPSENNAFKASKAYRLTENDNSLSGKDAIVYSISLTPEVINSGDYHTPVKDGCSITPLLYDSTTFRPFRIITIRQWTMASFDNTEDEMSEFAKYKLNDILTNPQEYKVKGKRACIVRMTIK